MLLVDLAHDCLLLGVLKADGTWVVVSLESDLLLSLFAEFDRRGGVV